MNAIIPDGRQGPGFQISLFGFRHTITLDNVLILEYLYYITKFTQMQGVSMTPTKSATKKSGKGLTAMEKAALRERLKEEKAEREGKSAESDVLAKIAEMPEPERSMAKRLHTIIKDSAPNLSPKTWYGMPAYANKDGKVVCFFQAASKYNTRYMTLGFQHDANLDDGDMWPVSFALIKLGSSEEAKIRALVKKAAR
jgi:uncharacterized protein YdhG (YjbR/CyaY superfamily)